MRRTVRTSSGVVISTVVTADSAQVQQPPPNVGMESTAIPVFGELPPYSANFHQHAFELDADAPSSALPNSYSYGGVEMRAIELRDGRVSLEMKEEIGFDFHEDRL